MSSKNMEQSTDDEYLKLFARYRKEHPGPTRMEDVGKWIEKERLLPTPKVDVVAIHTKKLKQAARRVRIKDLKGRKIRPWLAAKIEKWTASGQKIFDYTWDHIHEMSVDHALSAFEQRDEGIKKQKRSATRDLQSFLDYNPNAAGCERQFIFDFIDEEVVEAPVETIAETPAIPAKSTKPVTPMKPTKLSKPWLPPKG